MIHLPELDAFTARFAQCKYEPLRVTFRMEQNARIVNYDPIHLDGLLARAVVERATEGRLLADSEDGYWMPLPLKMLWRDDGGFPLWAASVLYPASDTVDDIYVRHKRNSDGVLHDKPNLKTRAGSYMDRRMPTPTQVCDAYEALCIGNLDAVQNLLDGFTYIGKLRLGRVLSVAVEIVDHDDQGVIWRGDSLIKPIPAQSELVQWLENPSLVGWTPPFWKPSLFAAGWRVGTRATDWFVDAPH